MRLLLFVAALVLLLVVTTGGQSRGQSKRCPTGEVHGFVAIRRDPPYLVGTLPSGFTANKDYFQRRYNCLGRSVQARRLDEGVYEVRFVGLRVETASVSAISDEGIAASYLPTSRDVVRVVLRGPITGGDIASRRDVPFSVVVF